MRLTRFFLLALLFGSLAEGRAPAQGTGTVAKLTIHDTIQPVTAAYLERGLRAAEQAHASLVLISLGTPGGLLDSTRSMVQAIESSAVPVVVFVSPSGSRAGSAGFFLLESADIAAMAPGTNAGAAHPLIEGGHVDPILKTKVENDAAALLRSIVAQRGRNVEAAEDAVRNSKSYTDREALTLKLIDLVAADDAALLAQLDGRTIHRFDGSPVTLHLLHAAVVPIPPSVRERALTYLVNPDIAVICLVLGGLLIFVEMNLPGTILPGVLGTLLILLGVFGLNLLPIRHTAVLLLFAAAAMLVLEMKYTTHGVLGTIGVFCLVGGLATLVDAPTSALRVHWATAIGGGVGFGVISLGLAWIALRAKRGKQMLGPQAMVGLLAVVQTPLCPTGQIEVRGELWRARMADRSWADAGEEVRVSDLEGLTLIVRKVLT